MAYNENIPVSGLLLDAVEIQENFYQGPPNIRTDLTVHGDITVSGDGSSAQVYFEDSTKYIDFNTSDEFDFSHDINTDSDIIGRDVKAKRYLYVNSDYAGGNQDANIYFNGTTQTLHFDYAAGQFEFSENIRSNGNTITIGDGYSNDIYLNFDITAFDFPGTRAPRGFRYNFSTSSMEVSHDGTTWNIVGTAEFSGNLSEVLGIGNKAYDKEAYIGTIYSQEAAGDNYIKLMAGTNPSDAEIEFNVSGYDIAHLNYDGVNDWLTIDKEFRIGSTSTSWYDLYSKDIYLGYAVAGYTEGKIFFGPSAENIKIHGIVDDLGPDTLNLYGDVITLNGTSATTGNLNVDGNLSVNDDYSAGDEDAIINFNNSAETLKFDYGLTAFMASAPNFYIGSAAAEDCSLFFYDDSSPTGKIWVANATGKLMVEDAYGVGELNIQATVSGVFQDFHNVTTVGNTTSNDIYVNSIFCDSHLYVNASGLNADGYIYFYNAAAADGEWLKFDDSDDQFETSNDLYINGVLRVASANMYMKNAGPDGDQYIYFYDGGSAINEYLRWFDASNRFEVSNALRVLGDFTTASTGTITCGTSATSTLYFSGTAASINWDASQFKFDAPIDITGAVTATSVDIAGEVRCNSLRVDQAATLGGIVQSHYIVISCNGVDYKIGLDAV